MTLLIHKRLASQLTHTAWGGSSRTTMVAKAFGGVSASELKLYLSH